MDYIVIARKYRPQSFNEVVGQEAIARTLTNAIKRERVAHGFLFTGPSGVGKTTMARILAKALACEQGPTATPCGVCDHCVMISESRHPDIYEIDAATRSKVDDIRELSESAAYSPSQARYRIYILDEVHMLSNSAWNALLKLLEEPPAHVYFIFATTEIDKVPATVVNRCQRFDFRSIDLGDISQRLREVCEKEGFQVEDSLLQRLARAAGGGMREAQTLLDQLIAVADGDIVEEDLNLLLGAARSTDLQKLFDALLAGTVGEALDTVDTLVSGGVAPSTLLEQLLDLTRQCMLMNACGPESSAVTRLGAVDEDMIARAKRAGQERLLRVCQLLLAAQQSIRLGVDARLQLEMSLVRIARIGEILDYEGLLKRVSRLESGAPTGPS